MSEENSFEIRFVSQGNGIGPFPKGNVRFLPGARVSLEEETRDPNPRALSGTYSDIGDCRVVILTREGERALENPLMMKGLLLQEADRPIFVGGFWWHQPSVQRPTIPPDDIGSWTATSGGNQGGGGC